MHDAPAPPDPGPTAEGGAAGRQAGYLTPERIDRILADFRGYLEALADPPPAPDREPPPFDLAALTAQFTALRHDVNLQTKAARGVGEQVSAALDRLTPVPKSDQSEQLKPLLKVLIDVADALGTAERQVRRTADSFTPLLDKLAAPALPEPPPTDIAPPGFFGKLFGTGKTSVTPAIGLQQWARDAITADEARTATATEAVERLAALIDGVADGYGISLRRIEKALPPFGLEPIDCVGRPFDPELMEVVEATGGTGKPTGTVVEVVRQGYRLNGQVFRFAQVRVAR